MFQNSNLGNPEALDLGDLNYIPVTGKDSEVPEVQVH